MESTQSMRKWIFFRLNEGITYFLRTIIQCRSDRQQFFSFLPTDVNQIFPIVNIEGIKSEVQLSEWYLIAVSEAAKKRRGLIRLNVGPNTFGRATSNDIKLCTALSSKTQCCIDVNDADVILTDLQSQNGTYVNNRKLVNEREILRSGDKIGFGCSPQNRFVKEITDEKRVVYELKYGNPLGDSSIPFEIPDSDDEEDDLKRFCPNQNVRISFESKAESGILSGSDEHQTDDENQEGEEDEFDVKPDLASLLRQQREYIQQAALQREIKQEIDWNIHQYNKESTGLNNNNVESDVVDCVVISDDSGDEVIVCEPQIKRKKTDTEWSNLLNAASKPLPPKKPQSLPIKPEYHPPPKYEMSETILREKIKIVRESRGQQLSDDLFKSNELLLNELTNKRPSTSINYSVSNGNRLNSKRFDIFDEFLHHEQMNAFISDITKWDVKRITAREYQNTLEYHLPYCTSNIELSFGDNLELYQKKMKSFTELELYSNIVDEFNRKSRTHQIFTILLPGYKEEIRQKEKRFVFQCKAQKSETKGLKFIRGDYAIVKHSNGEFLAFIFEVKQYPDHFTFKMESAKTSTNQLPSIKSKNIQVMPVINIRNTLECLYAIYKLEDSTLRDNVLKPNENIDDSVEYNGNQSQADIVRSIYEQIVKSVYGFGSTILTIVGGIGTGKSRTIVDLLEMFICEESNITGDQPILVCGITNDLVDKLAIGILPKNKDIIRFGDLQSINKKLKANVVGHKHLSSRLAVSQTMMNSSKCRIVFATAHEAIDLLQNEDCKFEICIVDDAALIPETHLLPLLRFDLKALVLVGDNKFKSPDMLSRCCCDKDFSRSLFGRVVECIDNVRTREKSSYPTLKVQYKMNNEIMMWPNKYFYKKTMIENNRPRIQKSPFPELTVFKVNTLEDIEEKFMEKLLNFMVNKDRGSPVTLSYGIICGNSKANESLNKLVKSTPNFNNIEVSDYYCFQGKEKNVIIITALSPNDGFELLGSIENLMVALTRATDTLIVCGNFQLVTDVVDARARDEARENPMSSIWKDFLKDADERHRLFDLDGEFNEKLVKKALIS